MAAILEGLVKAGEARNLSDEAATPAQTEHYLKISGHPMLKAAVDEFPPDATRSGIGHRVLPNDAPDGDASILVLSPFDQKVKDMVIAAGGKYTPPERTATVDPTLQRSIIQAAQRLQANKGILLKAQDMTRARQTKGSASGSASGSPSGSASGSRSGSASGSASGSTSGRTSNDGADGSGSASDQRAGGRRMVKPANKSEVDAMVVRCYDALTKADELGSEDVVLEIISQFSPGTIEHTAWTRVHAELF